MKKKLYVASIAMGIAVMATAFVAAADSNQNNMMSGSQKPILQVGTAGKVTMRGTIASVASGMLTVNSWGGTWTVNVGASAQILPTAAGTGITQFKAGDFVGVQGMVSQNASLTIDATLVRDWTLPAVMTQQRDENNQAAENIMKSNMPKNFEGVASNLSGNTFTLTADGMTNTVIVAPGAQVVNRNRLTLPLASIQSGDSVRVWGVNASGTITAQIVRDISTPPSATSTRL